MLAICFIAVPYRNQKLKAPEIHSITPAPNIFLQSSGGGEVQSVSDTAEFTVGRKVSFRNIFSTLQIRFVIPLFVKRTLVSPEARESPSTPLFHRTKIEHEI